MEFIIYFSNNNIKKYVIDDVIVMEEYPGRNNRWDEISIIFKDNSILWYGSGCITYAINGNEFIKDNRVITSGLYSKEGIESVKSNFSYEIFDKIKDKLNLVTKYGTYDDDYYFVWEV